MYYIGKRTSEANWKWAERLTDMKVSAPISLKRNWSSGSWAEVENVESLQTENHLSFQLNWAKENTDKSLIKDYHDFKQTKTIHYFSVNITYCLAEVVG